MTDDEKRVETGRLVERYAEIKRTIACLRSRLRETQRSFVSMGQALRNPEEIDPSPTANAYDLMGMRGQPRVVIDEAQLRADISDLREALDERERIERDLRHMNLGDVLE